MNLDKSKKLIAKKAKRGFQGYPLISIAYYGPHDQLATQVVLSFVAEEDAPAQLEKFSTQTDAREDATVQSTIVKIIERSGAKTLRLEPLVQECS
ncbi:MAG: hypothetical protein ACI9W6_001537 [Motiliproteus sp.]|jgi:hypothetical protein